MYSATSMSYSLVCPEPHSRACDITYCQRHCSWGQHLQHYFSNSLKSVQANNSGLTGYHLTVAVLHSVHSTHIMLQLYPSNINYKCYKALLKVILGICIHSMHNIQCSSTLPNCLESERMQILPQHYLSLWFALSDRTTLATCASPHVPRLVTSPNPTSI